MKSFKELAEDLTQNEALVEKFNQAIKEKPYCKEDTTRAFIEVAEEMGYEVSREKLEELAEEQKAVLGEEELGKVAGGSTPACILYGSIAATIVVTSGAFSIHKIFETIHC